MKVSVLLLTYNEAVNLPRCLEAVSWCDDVVIIDSGSTDDTVRLGTAWGARVLHRQFDNFAAQRNFGLEHGGICNEWVLHLDADEIVTPEFVAKIDNLVPPDDIDCYLVPSKLMFHKWWLRYCGMYPSYQARLGRRDRLRFVQFGHGQREDVAPDRVKIFEEPYLHYGFSRGIRDWLVRHVRYAEDEARQIVAQRENSGPVLKHFFSKDAAERRRALKLLSFRIPIFLRAPMRFLYVYIIRKGFLDGRIGFVYALMLSIYEGMISMFLFEIGSSQKERPNRDI